jgi:hypothetical protein
MELPKGKTTLRLLKPCQNINPLRYKGISVKKWSKLPLVENTLLIIFKPFSIAFHYKILKLTSVASTS